MLPSSIISNSILSMGFEVLINLENEFQISLPDEDVNEITMQKVSDLVKYIEEHVK